MEMGVVWKAIGGYPLDNYVLVSRFDRVDISTTFGGALFPKVARKLAERRSGVRYRFRHEHKPHNGLLSPDTWPRDGLIVDRYAVRIPDDVAPGDYRVMVKLMAVPNQTNYALRDFFFDDDIYQGVEITRITIE